jgi:hypothetical protein
MELLAVTIDQTIELGHMACFPYVANLRAVVAPIYVEFIDETVNWRWIGGIQEVANVYLLIAIAVFLRETRRDMTLHKRAKALRNATETRDTKQKWTSKPITSKRCSNIPPLKQPIFL